MPRKKALTLQLHGSSPLSQYERFYPIQGICYNILSKKGWKPLTPHGTALDFF